jgi:hypothetical protein
MVGDMSGAPAVLGLLGLVVLSVMAWCVLHVRREALRRRQVARVRAILEPRPTVAELRRRCGADGLPRYPSPTPTGVVGGPHPAAPVGPTANPVERAS